MMKQYLFNRALQKQARQRPRVKRFVTYAAARRVLLLFRSDGVDEAIHRMIGSLRADGKEVNAVGLLSPKASLPVDNASTGLHILVKGDITLWGRPRKRFMQQLPTGAYDLVIDLSQNPSLPLSYVALAADAPMKSGGAQADPRVFDFIVDTPSEDVQFLFDQITFYLKRIHTTD